VLLFAQAREAAGVSGLSVAGATVEAVLAELADRFGPTLGEVLAVSRVWVNGEPAASGDPVGSSDEVAILPPVSGG
jgi:molybdopterin synthase sulfur carrier subunit